MAHHRKLLRTWKHTRKLTLAASCALWLGTGTGAVFALRENNLTMLSLRDAVFAADAAEGGDVSGALTELQRYVTVHMNTSLPKLGNEKAIQLKYTYDRLVAAEDQRVSAERVAIADAAAAFCESALPNVRLTVRAQCVQEYIEARPVAARTIPKELYTFDFVSPLWSPDAAGWLVVSFVIASIVLLVRVVSGILVRRSLKRGI